MKSILKITVATVILLMATVLPSKAQSIRLLGGDLANGAINGVALGGATMALQNSSDRAPLRVGLGLGILYGIGTGIYDHSIISKGEQFYKSGTFNDGRNSTIIVLLDTFYGAAGGAAIGAAISLIGNNSLIDGLQYGSGAGAWIGFGFGLIDSFVLAEGPNDLRQAAKLSESKNKATGIVQVTPSNDENFSLGLINPTLISQKVIGKQSLKINHSMGLQVVNVQLNF